MAGTVLNAATSLSIGLFFSLLIVGISGSLSSALYGGLTAHGVPTTLVEGVDRAGLVMTPTGAAVVARVLRELRQ